MGNNGSLAHTSVYLLLQKIPILLYYLQIQFSPLIRLASDQSDVLVNFYLTLIYHLYANFVYVRALVPLKEGVWV